VPAGRRCSIERVSTTPLSTAIDEGDLFISHPRSQAKTCSMFQLLWITSHLVWGCVVPDIVDFCCELVAALAEE